MAMGGFKGDSVPIDNQKETTFADALPQALVLTSIVISFAVTSFFLVLAYQAYKYTKTDNLDEMRGADQDRKSTRLNSSHVAISYAVFRSKKKTHVQRQCAA